MYAYAAASLQRRWYTGARLIDWAIIKAVGRTICAPFCYNAWVDIIRPFIRKTPWYCLFGNTTAINIITDMYITFSP